MPMRENGLAKLIEECGELLQIAGKMVQYPELQHEGYTPHPSGYNLRGRLEEEIGDVIASVYYVIDELNLSNRAVEKRVEQKLSLFKSVYRNEVPITGHGWVTPRPDGFKARCGGPEVCRQCQEEARNVP